MKKYNVYYIETLQKQIISNLEGQTFGSIDNDLRDTLLEWMELQDPIFGEKGYPYYPNMEDDFRIENEEDFTPEFISNMKQQLLREYEERYKN